MSTARSARRQPQRDPALVRVGLDPADAEVVAARRTASEDVARRYATRRSFLHRELFRDRVVRTAELLGVQPTADVLDRFHEENVRAIVAHVPPRPDEVVDLVDAGNGTR